MFVCVWVLMLTLIKVLLIFFILCLYDKICAEFARTYLQKTKSKYKIRILFALVSCMLCLPGLTTFTEHFSFFPNFSLYVSLNFDPIYLRYLSTSE